MKQKNAQAIANLQMLIALRLDKKNHLEKIIANDQQPTRALPEQGLLNSNGMILPIGQN
jgi:hypothetical protein